MRESVRWCVQVMVWCSLVLAAACDAGPQEEMPGGIPQDAAQQAATVTPTPRAVPAKSVDDTSTLMVTTRSQQGCTFVAPPAWGVDVGKDSAGIDIYNSTSTMFASYRVYPVNTAIGPYAGAYPPPMNDPDFYSPDPKRVVRALLRLAVVQNGGAPDMDFTADAPESLPPYTAVTLRGSTHSALVIYTAVPGGPQNYVVPIRAAIMSNQHWPDMAGALAQMAMGIRCTTQLRVPSDLPTPGRTRRDKDNNDKGDEAGYNPWRGSEYVHDPNTGDNFIVTSGHWSDTGPDGPGYYKRNGNDWTKLSPGRSR